MLEMPKYRNPITLIPGGLPQLLDYAADLPLIEKIRYQFEELPDKKSRDRDKVFLHAYRKNPEGDFVDELDPESLSSDDAYSVTGIAAIAPWLNEWLPVPFLRVRDDVWPDDEECRFEYGPTNWARARLAPNPDDPDSWRLVLAFDMQVENRDSDLYAALCPEDVDSHARFRLAWRFRDNAWFMELPWVDEWLRELWHAHQKKLRRRQSDDEKQFEYLAYYLTFLEVIHKISANCEVSVIRPDGRSSVDVDLVLDIGNSRTTGILVETQTQSVTNLNDSYLLQLRDMGKPENIYTDPFETRIEFAEITFGNDALSLRSGRRQPAFVWPSPARIGPEAGRLATLSRCEKGTTGMSSPKRYLWDERDWQRSWRFNTGTEKAPFVTRGPLAQKINSSGTPLFCFEAKKVPAYIDMQEHESAFESYFTRSSLMMFLLVEIIQQALLTINSPGQRIRRDLPARPRRLRQIIFTVPGGMPMAEQKIYKRWVNWAVRVLWQALGWEDYYVEDPARYANNNDCDYRTNPAVRCDWDEATCTQLVYIYNELTRKYQGDAVLFCETMGRQRKFGDQFSPSLRIATIDIGGGTTDLSITTFQLASDSGATARMIAHPDFHDGFNFAGDDILRAVIWEHLLQAIGEAMQKAGVLNIKDALSSLFGRDTMDSSKDVMNQKAQFTRQIAVPAALYLLKKYEEADLRKNSFPITFNLGDCFRKILVSPEGQPAPEDTTAEADADLAPVPGPGALEYVKNFVASHSQDDNFNILDVPVKVEARQIDETVKSVLKSILADLCEVIRMYDCDVLLLTGRPTRWPAIVNTFYSLVPLPPSRIIPMGEYKVGGWYPFSDALGNMSDPKTTVVVGAILSTLAEGQLEGFSFDSRNISLYSTARFIGEMELDSKIKKEKVWFEVNPQTNEVTPKEREISFSGPTSVGFRQLDADRWTTTRFYMFEFANEAARIKNLDRLPLKITLAFEPNTMMDEDTGNRKNRDNRDEGEFQIIKITDDNGEEISGKPVVKRLQTLPRNDGFWMDTGIIEGD